MKVDLTRKAYESRYGENPLFREFDETVRTMDVEAKEILDGSLEMDVAGEILIYGVLARDQVDVTTAAKAAVAFPSPIHFNGFINTQDYSDCLVTYQLFRQGGKSPLVSLLQVVEQCDKRGMPKSFYEERCQKFREFVEAKV
ncbi:MAG: hypothetical protein WC796_03930 [Candidatus Pacearchaeota archaeon]|jgi:hypothetical protein